MKKNDIYIGIIRIIENGDNHIFEGYCPLLFLGNGAYVNLRWIRTTKQKLKLIRVLLTGELDEEIVLYESVNNGLYVDKNTLVQYYEDSLNKHISLKRVKHDLLYDVRIAGPNCIDMS